MRFSDRPAGYLTSVHSYFTHEDAFAGWSRLHGGLDPRASVWIRGWVRLAQICAGPFVRWGVHPNTVTIIGLAVTATVPAIAAAGAAWPLAALMLLLAGAVLDGVDGAVAVRAGLASRWGKVLDPFADRCSDLLLILTLVILGAPMWLGVALGAVTLLLESVRANAQAAGMVGAGVITWWERPSRVIVASCAAAGSGIEWCARRGGVVVLPGVDGDLLATLFAVVAMVLAVVGLGRLLFAVRSQLRD